MWIRPPAMWKLKPSSHKTRRTTKISQSMGISSPQWRRLRPGSGLGRRHCIHNRLRTPNLKRGPALLHL
jgi:hypothetical protein